MQKLLIVLTVLLTLGSCKKDDEPFTVNPCGVDFETTLKYIAIGDEFTAGIYLQTEDTYPYEVRQYLIDNGYPDIELSVVGDEELSCNELSELLTDNNATNCKNLSTVMIGVHDILANRSTIEFKTDYELLIDQTIDFTGSTSQVTCVGLPDFSQAPGLPSSAGTPQEVKSMILSYNTAIEEVCTEKGVNYADIFPISEASYELMVAEEDEFHPTAPQHLLWANVISGEVENGLD